MSTSPVSSSSSATTGYLLSSLSGSQSMQITGLASGLNTNQIIAEEMALYQQPVTHLQNQVSGQKAMNTALTNIQNEVQTLGSDALAIGDPTLFKTSQTVTTSDPTKLTATTGSGAGVGGYQVSVTQLANSAQRTFTFASPTSADQVTIDGQQVTVPAGQSINDFVSSVNSNSNLDVYAAATNSGTVVLSNRNTGDTGTRFIAVTDANGGTMTEQTALAKQGKNALYSVDGVSGSSASNTVSGGIAGVSLTLTGVTTTSGPVTVNVGAPAPNSTSISNAINAFVTQYNKVISDVQTQLTTPPSSSDPTVGTLYGDPQLKDLLSQMRTSMYTPGSGLPVGLQTMLDVGVSTGASTGSGAISQASLSGNLTLNSTTLLNQLQANPTGVKSVLGAWSKGFVTLTDNAADPAGTISSRIAGDNVAITQLGNQISSMQSALADKQASLVQQFAQLESALSSNQSTSSWLTGQIASLPGV